MGNFDIGVEGGGFLVVGGGDCMWKELTHLEWIALWSCWKALHPKP